MSARRLRDLDVPSLGDLDASRLPGVDAPRLGSHEGVGGAVREATPEWLRPAFAAVSVLGNAGLLVGAAVLDHWAGDRERGARGVALLAGAMAYALALKASFDASRPPAAVTRVAVSDYAFPSGHVLVATVGLGFLALSLDVSTRRRRLAAAALAVSLVAVARLGLGVHFLRDVVAGAGFGAAYLAVGYLATDRGPGAGFRLAAAMGLGAVVVTGGGQYALGLLGATLAGAVAWPRLDHRPAAAGRERHRLALVGGGLPAVAALGYAATLPRLSRPTAFVLGVALMGVVLGVPALASRLGGDWRDD